MKHGKYIWHNVLPAGLPLVLLCLFAWQPVIALSGSKHITYYGEHVLKHKPASADHFNSFPVNGKKNDLHLSQRFKYKAKCFYGIAASAAVVHETSGLPVNTHVRSLYRSTLVRPGYYTFLFRYKPF